MSTEQNTKYQLQVARALIAMQGLTVAELSERTNIHQDNLEAFLGGATAALTLRSSFALFRYLGVEGNGMKKEKVHFWHIKMDRRNNIKNLLPLATVLPLIDKHEAMMLKPRNGIIPVMIKAGEIRIVLFVRVPKFYSMTVSDIGLTPGTFEGHNKISGLPEYYYDLIFTGALRPSYFDLILEGDYINESLELLRIVALEHDITLSGIVELIVNRKGKPKTGHLETPPVNAPSQPASITTSVVMESVVMESVQAAAETPAPVRTLPTQLTQITSEDGFDETPSRHAGAAR